MIAEEFKRAIIEVWQWAWAHSFGLVDPFWGYLFDGLVIIGIAALVGWTFSSLRPVAGTVILSAVAFLVGFWKGEGVRRKK